MFVRLFVGQHGIQNNRWFYFWVIFVRPWCDFVCVCVCEKMSHLHTTIGNTKDKVHFVEYYKIANKQKSWQSYLYYNIQSNYLQQFSGNSILVIEPNAIAYYVIIDYAKQNVVWFFLVTNRQINWRKKNKTKSLEDGENFEIVKMKPVSDFFVEICFIHTRRLWMGFADENEKHHEHACVKCIYSIRFFSWSF